MKLNSLSIIATCLSFGLLACSNTGNKRSEKNTVSGKLTNLNSGNIYLEKISQKGFQPFDTASVNNDGTFSFDNPIDGISFYRLSLSQNNYCMLILEEGKEIKLETDANKLSELKKVDGSEESKLLNELSSQARKNYMRMDSLQKAFQTQATDANREELSKKLGGEYNAIRMEQMEVAKKFIDKHPDAYASLSAIEMLNPDEHTAYFEKVDNAVSKKFPKSDYVIAFHTRVADMKRLAIGSPAPELTMDSPDGKKVSVSQFKGKVLLVDFWASWCRPCRAENPNVVKMYAKLHPQGLEILGVSLDQNKDAWLKAIDSDKLTWNHMSDLAQWNSAATKIYGITGIPMTYLIDRDGNIAAKGLRGEELEKKVEELLQKK